MISLLDIAEVGEFKLVNMGLLPSHPNMYSTSVSDLNGRPLEVTIYPQGDKVNPEYEARIRSAFMSVLRNQHELLIGAKDLIEGLLKEYELHMPPDFSTLVSKLSASLIKVPESGLIEVFFGSCSYFEHLDLVAELNQDGSIGFVAFDG